jgi:hypothetical protein
LAHRRGCTVRGTCGLPERPRARERPGNRSVDQDHVCLIDWYTLEGNANTKARIYWECQTGLQGISPGWVDQYHQSLEGQKLDITGAKPGRYYLVSTANYAGTYLEANYTNNTAWQSFELTRDSSGNPKIALAGHSTCETPGLCGVGAPNR